MNVQDLVPFIKSLSNKKHVQHFATSGIWTAPIGVTQVFITACGGGAGGAGQTGSSGVLGTNGGSTSFGSLLILNGGLNTGVSGGYISGNGFVGGYGGSSVFMNGVSFPTSTVNNAKGTGGATYLVYSNEKGGGAGAGVINYPLTVVSGTSYTITIGLGGAGGGTYVSGQKGGDGYMIIEWYE